MNPRQILFATDLYGHDKSAFEQSCQLAMDWNATLNIVHVQDSEKSGDSNRSPRLFKNYTPKDLSIDCAQILLNGDPATEILDFASSRNASLIVLGTHGRSGLDRFFGGSVAEAVARKSTCPVMTTRPGVPSKSCMKRILVPIDFSVFGYAAIEFASHLAAANQSKLTICHISDSATAAGTLQRSGDDIDRANPSKLWRQLREFKPKSAQTRFEHLHLSGSPAELICDFASKESFDYIVIGTHGRTGVRRAIMGSVAEFVVRHANCPVITVKPTNNRTSIGIHRASLLDRD